MNQIIKLIFSVILVVILLAGLWFFYQNLEFKSPENTVTIDHRQGILESVRQVNKQIFIEHYHMVDIEYTEVPEGILGMLGIKQNIIVLIRGRVPAGFQLGNIDEDDIWVSSDGTRAQITLPPPVIFEENIAFDFENSRVLSTSDTCPNFICPTDTLAAYQELVLPAAREKLIVYARESGILDQAARDGEAYYTQLLKSLGFEEVRVIVEGYE